MTIPNVTPYTGQVANPDGSQTQTEFTQNMFDQLSYEAQLATDINATVDGMNQTAIEVQANATSASQSAAAAEAAAVSAGYKGLWPDTGGSANKGETYQTQVGGTPTGNYFTALQNTTVDPVGDNVNWKISNGYNSIFLFDNISDMKSGVTLDGNITNIKEGQMLLLKNGSNFVIYDAVSSGNVLASDVQLDNGLYASERVSSVPNEDKMFMGVFFRGNTDTTIEVSFSDGGARKFGRVLTLPKGLNVKGRDPHYIYAKGWHLIAVTGSSVNNYDLTIHRSRDFANWETINANLGEVPVCSDTVPVTGGSVPADFIWAPKWVVDGDTLYITSTIHYAADELNKDGVLVQYKRVFISECTDVDALNFTYPVELDTRDGINQGNQIDAAIYLIDGEWILLVKNEYEKELEIHKATSLQGTYSYVSTVPFGRDVEGGTLVRSFNGYLIYGDAYNEPWQYRVDADATFTSFQSPMPLIYDAPIRHGHVVRVDDQFQPYKIYKDVARAALANYTDDMVSTYNVGLGSGVVELKPVSDLTYSLGGSDQAEVDIAANNATNFYILVASDDKNAQVVIKNGTYFASPNGDDLVLGRGDGSNKLYQFRKYTDGKYRAVGDTGYSTNIQGLRSFGGGSSISNLNPKHGMILTTTPTDTGETVINSFDASVPVGTTFKLVTLSGGVNGVIRIAQAATNMQEHVISGALGAQGIAVEVTKVDGDPSTSGTWIVTGYPS